MITQTKDTAAGLQIATSASQKVGLHGATPSAQRAGAAQAVATDLPSALILINELRAALIEKGIIKGAA